MRRRAHAAHTGEGIDMAMAESLAFGSLLLAYEPGDDADFWAYAAADSSTSSANSDNGRGRGNGREGKQQRLKRANISSKHELRLAATAGLHRNVPVRISGQDCERGTFNQRHAVVASQTGPVGMKCVPLNHMVDGTTATQSEFIVCNSSLSEASVPAL